jgi:hypothetical protein
MSECFRGDVLLVHRDGSYRAVSYFEAKQRYPLLHALLPDAPAQYNQATDA